MITSRQVNRTTKEIAKVPLHGFLAQKVQLAGSEPLIQEADPHITKLANRSSDVGTDGPNKKIKKGSTLPISCSAELNY